MRWFPGCFTKGSSTMTLSTGPTPRAPVTFFIITLYFESPATTSRLVKCMRLVAIYVMMTII